MSEQQTEWRQVKIGELLTEHSERSISSNQHEVLSVTKDGIFSQREYFKKQIASEDNSGYKVVRRGDVVFSAMNLWMGSIDVVKDQEIGIVSPAYITMRPTEGLIDTGFLGYFLRGDEMRKKYVQHSQQGASIVRRNLNKDDLLDDEVCIPPLSEQKKIAEMLSGIDLLIRRNEKRVQKLQLSHASLSAKAFQIELEKEQAAVALGDVVALRHGYQFRTPDFAQNGAKVIKISQVIGDGVVLTEDCDRVPWELAADKEKFRLRPGDVLMSLTGNIGRVGIVPKTDEVLLQNYRVGLFAPIDERISRKYMIHLLESRQVVSQLEDNANASAQANFGKGDLDKIMVYLPDLQKQEKTASLLSSSKDLIKAEKRKIAALRKAKLSISADLLTGRKRVSV